jgi:molybdopterin converting factor small subunit
VPRVFLPRGLRALAGGRGDLEVAGATVREVLEALERLHPGLGARLRNGMAVSIDGDIVQDPLLEPVDAESELHFLPPISGG